MRIYSERVKIKTNDDENEREKKIIDNDALMAREIRSE